MYCRKCGNKISDTDHYCQYCGTPTGFKDTLSAPGDPEEATEEIVFNPPYDNKSHFDEEEGSAPEPEEYLKEFISEKEIDVHKDIQKSGEEAFEPQMAKSSEFNWNVHEFPQNRKTDDVEFNWDIEEFGPQNKKDFESTEQKEAAATAFEEELFREIRDESSRIREQNIDRFFTFSRKNEEFQKLLDQEYEKFRIRPDSDLIMESEDQTEEKTPQTEAAAEVPEEAQYDEPSLDTEHPAESESSEELELPAESESPEEHKLPGEPDSPAGPVKAEHISEMALARAQFFGEELIRDNESIKKKLTSEEPEEPEAPAEQSEQQEIETPAEQEEQQETEAVMEPAERENPEESSKTVIETVSEETGQKSKRSAGRIILVIIAVILAAEIMILGIRYFAPESMAARMINDAQTRIIQTVSGWADEINDMFSGNASDDDAKGGTDAEGDKPEQESPDPNQPGDEVENMPAPDPNPMADKNALVSSQLGNNINIVEVKANESLAYRPGTDYGQADINNSKTITNNIWQTPENGEPVYYDKAIAGAIIAFDSQWIDYVNEGNQSALELLKKDSEAYRKAISFSKVGKVKETFKLLEIGEIRQGADGFYLWAHEEIQITEKGKTTNQKYNWIYCLEPIDGKMQIVNYFKFQ